MNRIALVLTILACLLVAGAPLHAEESLVTEVSLLVGFPDSSEGTDDSKGALVVPGIVIPLSSPKPAATGSYESARNAALLRIAQGLEKTVRLEKVDISYRQRHTLQLDEAKRLPGPSDASPISASVTLLGFNDELATYRVQFNQGAVVLADTQVATERGREAIVGGLDGEEAPYLFLVVRPEGQKTRGHSKSGAVHLLEDFTPPRRISGPAPQYTAEAKEERVQGVVILQTVIDTDGAVKEVKVLKGLPLGLSEAAVEAVEGWVFEAARDADGNPVAVYYNLTINFRLE